MVTIIDTVACGYARGVAAIGQLDGVASLALRPILGPVPLAVIGGGRYTSLAEAFVRMAPRLRDAKG